MLISDLEKALAEIKAKEGDIEVVVMTAPFGDGETEVMERGHFHVWKNEPNHGTSRTVKNLTFL